MLALQAIREERFKQEIVPYEIKNKKEQSKNRFVQPVGYFTKEGLIMAKYFEEFSVGEKYTSSARTVTETDIVLFAGLSGDYNPLHTDLEFAKGTIFGEFILYNQRKEIVQQGTLPIMVKRKG